MHGSPITDFSAKITNQTLGGVRNTNSVHRSWRSKTAENHQNVLPASQRRLPNPSNPSKGSSTAKLGNSASLAASPESKTKSIASSLGVSLSTSSAIVVEIGSKASGRQLSRTTPSFCGNEIGSAIQKVSGEYAVFHFRKAQFRAPMAPDVQVDLRASRSHPTPVLPGERRPR
jgi:hypothetical protein